MKTKYWLILILVLAIVYAVTMEFAAIRAKEGIEQVRQETVASAKQKEFQKQAAMTKWIYDYGPTLPMNTAIEIYKETSKYKLNLLLLAMFEHESAGFNITATSKLPKDPARGLGQVRFGVHKAALAKIGITDYKELYDIGLNVAASNLILEDCLRRTNGDVASALELYLGGKDGRYVHRILSNLARLVVLNEKI